MAIVMLGIAKVRLDYGYKCMANLRLGIAKLCLDYGLYVPRNG